jgi:hypothetical protein
VVETWEEALLHGTSTFLSPDHPWHNNAVNFNNKVETREAPEALSGAQVLEQYDTFEQVEFGKTLLSQKRKHDEDNRWHNWWKKSIFLSSLAGLLCSLGFACPYCHKHTNYLRFKQGKKQC